MSASSDNVKKELKSYKRQGGNWIRYLFAKAWCSSARVLDYGCGYGFGALILDNFYEYVGFDVDSNAIEWAHKHISPIKKGTSFLRNNQFKMESEIESYDTVIAYEVIEHVEEPVLLIRSLLNCLKAHGTLIISTPNGAFSDHNKLLFRTAFHIDEYSAIELRGIIERAGGNAKFYKEYRIDGFDVRRLNSLMTTVQESASSVSNTHKSIKNRITTSNRLFSFAYRYLNSPRLYRIKEFSSDDFNKCDCSTIVVIISKKLR